MGFIHILLPERNLYFLTFLKNCFSNRFPFTKKNLDRNDDVYRCEFAWIIQT
jgi:hypothetical protein